MKKILSVFFVMISIQIYGQVLNRKWIEVIQLPEQKVYVDTSTIKQLEGQVSVLSISYFTPPKMITALGSEAASVKSQLLFNLANQKFTTVGTLYYDKKLKILGESSSPGLSLSGESFAIPIDSNQAMIAVYAYCLNYINKGERVIENKDFSNHGEKIKSFIDNKIKIDAAKGISTADSQKQMNTVSQETKREIQQKKTGAKKELTGPIRKDSSVKVVGLPDRKDDALMTLSAKKKNEDEGGIEISPRSAIFKDGNKYSFQVSSWKNKGKAEGELTRLKSEGHNAFLVEAYIAARGGTWYRVRIGYFNSLEETEAYMKKLK
jgi:hypothetical protein